jgi:hypothetical protein
LFDVWVKYRYALYDTPCLYNHLSQLWHSGRRKKSVIPFVRSVYCFITVVSISEFGF